MKNIIFYVLLICLTSIAVLFPNRGLCIGLSNSIDIPFENLHSVKSKNLSLGERITLRLLKKRIEKQQRRIMQQINEMLPKAGCSKIVLKKGDIIEANVIQITPTEVKYKRCGKPNDPEIILAKRDVLSVIADDGEVIFRNTSNAVGGTANDEQKLDSLAIASLATGAGGLLIGLLLSGFIGILAGIVGIVLGGISLFRIKRNPDKYRGKGMAWAGTICGIVIVGLFIILLAVYI